MQHVVDQILDHAPAKLQTVLLSLLRHGYTLPELEEAVSLLESWSDKDRQEARVIFRLLQDARARYPALRDTKCRRHRSRRVS